MSKPVKTNPDLGDTVLHKSPAPRRSTTKDARAVRSAEALRAAMLSLLERQAFEQISIRDICAEAGVHYATFFRHHASKEELLEQIAAEQINVVVDLTLPIRESIDDATAFHAICAYVGRHRALWAVLLNGGAGQAMREAWLRRAMTVAATQESIGSWLPKELGTICSVSLIVETISWWLTQPEEAYSFEDVSDILQRLVVRSTLAQD